MDREYKTQFFRDNYGGNKYTSRNHWFDHLIGKADVGNNNHSKRTVNNVELDPLDRKPLKSLKASRNKSIHALLNQNY